MKSTTIVCALAAASLGIGSLSFAQGYERDRRDDDRQGYQQRDHDRRDGDRDRRADNDRRDRREGMGNRGDFRRDGRAEYHYGARGPEWRRGGRIPPEYRRPQYVVHDWRAHRLHAPPRGYQWVQVGSDYVLVAVATGIIAQLLLSQ
ncbi:MAG TPA: RcnB family protein [Ramlibacter sp.]|nr:RcnB family protein [Ramlibacter sp.]